MAKHAFIQKLEAYAPIDDSDKALIDRLLGEGHLYSAHSDVIAENENPDDVHIVLSGLACRYKFLPDGKRQISAFLIPGDFCDLNIFILKRMDHAISCIQKSVICAIKRHQVFELLERPVIARALLLGNLVDEAILREWVTNIGQRHAAERMAHLFCELYLRMRIVGLVDGNDFDLPITQNELGDALGLSLVHTNKSLRQLRLDGLVTLSGGVLRIVDMANLRRKCQFNANYLHLTGGDPWVGEEKTKVS